MATYERKQILDYTLGDPTIDLYSGFSVLDDKLSLSEWPIYGSARLGVLDLNGKGELYNNGTAMWTKPLSHTKAGYRQYEIANHLGNVLATISDVKTGIDNPVDGTIDFYEPKLVSRQDYYPFGMIMPGRNDAKKDYRFGYNTQEKVDEISGNGNHTTAPFWEYDTRTGRRWNRDPITYPWQSPYSTNNNNPIVFTDPLGLFGSRKEARDYKKEHGLKGRIQKGDDGIFAINDKKGGTSYFRDHSLDDVPDLLGRQDDGVIKSVFVNPDESGPSLSAYVDGAKKYGKRGGFELRKKDINKYAYESTKYLKQEFGIKIKPSTVTSNIVESNKWVTKQFAKRAPVIGNVLDAWEVVEGIQADGNALGANTAIEVAGVAGGSFGAWGCATLCAMAGTILIPIPGVGTVIGATFGAIMGSWGGEEGAEFFMKKITKEE